MAEGDSIVLRARQEAVRGPGGIFRTLASSAGAIGG